MDTCTTESGRLCIGCDGLLIDDEVPICASCGLLTPWARGATADAVVYAIKVPLLSRAPLREVLARHRLDTSEDESNEWHLGRFPMRTAAAMESHLRKRGGLHVVALPRASSLARWLGFKRCLRRLASHAGAALMCLPFLSVILAVLLLWLITWGTTSTVRRLARGRASRRIGRKSPSATRAEAQRHELAVAMAAAPPTTPEIELALGLVRTARLHSSSLEGLVLAHMTRRLRDGRSLACALPRLARIVGAKLTGRALDRSAVVQARLSDLECRIAACAEIAQCIP